MNKVNSRQPIEIVFSGASGKLKDTNIPEAIIEGNNSITVQNRNTMNEVLSSANGKEYSNSVGDFIKENNPVALWKNILINPERQEERRKLRDDKKAAKNKLRDAEANQTNAIAQALMSPDGGMSTGAIIGIALGGVLLLGGITLLIIKSKKK
jgi:hypothetical protein